MALVSIAVTVNVNAQGCDPLSSWIVSLGCRGPADNGRTICVNGTAVCQMVCNNRTDCGSGQTCTDGLCVNALVPCNNNGDCGDGFGCNGNTGVCAPCGTDGVQCGPIDRCAGVNCDDGRGCNGTERCVDGSCTRGTPLDCDDHDAATNDRCIEDGLGADRISRAHCDNYTPSKCKRHLGTADIRFTRAGSRSVGLTWSGTIDSLGSSKPNDLRILLTDGKGAPLVDAHAGADNGSWISGASGWSWTPRDRKTSVIRRAALGRNGTYQVEANTGTDRLDLGRVLTPSGAVLVDFVAPDEADICAGIPVPECIPGRYGLQCRTKFRGGPNP
jgi:hypothetical protein